MIPDTDEDDEEPYDPFLAQFVNKGRVTTEIYTLNSVQATEEHENMERRVFSDCKMNHQSLKGEVQDIFPSG